jgi:hypothetical protein
MITVHFSAAGLRRIVLNNPTAMGREFDLAALMAVQPHVLAADRTLIQLTGESIHPGTDQKVRNP